MYLELIFTEIKTERWKVAEERLSVEGLKQVRKIVCVEVKTNTKDCLCRVWSRENARVKIVDPEIECKKDWLCRGLKIA